MIVLSYSSYRETSLVTEGDSGDDSDLLFEIYNVVIITFNIL